jgi:hypothetical protein
VLITCAPFNRGVTQRCLQSTSSSVVLVDGTVQGSSLALALGGGWGANAHRFDLVELILRKVTASTPGSVWSLVAQLAI